MLGLEKFCSLYSLHWQLRSIGGLTLNWARSVSKAFLFFTETDAEEPKERVRGFEATDEFAAPDILLEEGQESVRSGKVDSCRIDFVNTMKSCRLCCVAFWDTSCQSAHIRIDQERLAKVSGSESSSGRPSSSLFQSCQYWYCSGEYLW